MRTATGSSTESYARHVESWIWENVPGRDSGAWDVSKACAKGKAQFQKTPLYEIRRAFNSVISQLLEGVRDIDGEKEVAARERKSRVVELRARWL